MLNPEQIKELQQKYQIGISSKNALNIPPKEERKNIFQRIAGQYSQYIPETIKNIQEGAKELEEAGEVGFKEGIIKTGKGIYKAGVRPAADFLTTAFAPLSEMIGAGLKATGAQNLINKAGQVIADESGITDLPAFQKFAIEHPEAEKDFGRILTLGMMALTKGGREDLQKEIRPIETVKEVAVKPIITAGEKVVRGVSTVVKKTKTTLFGRPAQIRNIDDVIKQADETLKPAQIRANAEQTTAMPSLKERWVGIRPDIKNRIAGKPDMMKEYFDVVHTRNLDDTLPMGLEYGVKKGVNPALEIMENKLNKTGGDVGTFRQKIGTYEANITNIAKIENTFNNQLNQLNLEVKSGQVRQIPGTVSRVSGKGDIGVLNDLYKELLTVKQNPNLEKLMDLRNIFDRKINFEKTAREVSSSIDPVSRNVRKSIADVGAEIVGKSEASKLKQYSDFMNAFESIKSFTDRKAGGEFLLKILLSERGGVPREIVQTIKKHTGIDLMDHATMAQIATDLIGNSSQKGLFRQEITKAGLDTAAILTGKTSGAIDLMLKFGGKIIDKEKAFLKAARNK